MEEKAAYEREKSQSRRNSSSSSISNSSSNSSRTATEQRHEDSNNKTSNAGSHILQPENDAVSNPSQDNQKERLSGNDEAADDLFAGDGVLDRILSRISTKPSIKPAPPPDGGLQAWMQCFACHLAMMNTWGWINSFGTFQTYYITVLPVSNVAISFIGSVTVCLLFLIGVLTGRLTDAGLFRPVFVLGIVLQILGIFTTSACKEYWQFILAQGLCIGFGSGCIFCPALAVLSSYFDRKRALVIGIAMSGSATGGLVFPSMVRQLLPQIGFGWTIRCIGFVQLAAFAVAFSILRPRLPPRKSGKLVELKAFKELDYAFYAAGAYFCFWGVYIAFYYLGSFGRAVVHPSFTFPHSLNLLLVLNGVGFIGRIAPAYVASHAGGVNCFIPMAAGSSILSFCWIAVKTPGGLYAWTVMFGLLGGAVQGLFPAALSCLTTDLSKLGVRMGMVFTIVSIAMLTGPPIAGAIIEGPGGYLGAQVFAGSCLAVGSLFLLAAKLVKMRTAGLGWTDKV